MRCLCSHFKNETNQLWFHNFLYMIFSLEMRIRILLHKLSIEFCEKSCQFSDSTCFDGVHCIRYDWCLLNKAVDDERAKIHVESCRNRFDNTQIEHWTCILLTIACMKHSYVRNIYEFSNIFPQFIFAKLGNATFCKFNIRIVIKSPLISTYFTALSNGSVWNHWNMQIICIFWQLHK